MGLRPLRAMYFFADLTHRARVNRFGGHLVEITSMIRATTSCPILANPVNPCFCLPTFFFQDLLEAVMAWMDTVVGMDTIGSMLANAALNPVRLCTLV